MSHPAPMGSGLHITGDVTNSTLIGVNYGTVTIVQAAQQLSSPHQLRAALAGFIGRSRETEQLLGALRSPQPGAAAVAAICGMGGTGKTELALRVANILMADYPDAQLSIALRGSEIAERLSAADGLRAAIRAFDPGANLPDDEQALAALYRGHLGGKRALVLLDDAPDGATVRLFVPPAGCALLVTARTRLWLRGLGPVLNLGLLQRDEARELVLREAPHLAHDTELGELLERCADLPLALNVAAGVLATSPDMTLASYIRRLDDESQRSDALQLEDIDVVRVLGASDSLLAEESPSLARRWRMLGVCSAPFDVAAAAAIWGEHDGEAVAQALATLVQRSLLRHDRELGQFEVHDLLRDVAASRRAAEDDRAARLGHASHFLMVVQEAQRLYELGHDDAIRGLRLFDASARHIRAAAAWAAVAGTPEADRLMVSTIQNRSILELRATPEELDRWFEAVLAAAQRLRSERDAGRALVYLGNASLVRGDAERATALYEQALDAARTASDTLAEGWALAGLGHAAAERGDQERAIQLTREWLALARAIGDRREEGQALVNLGAAYSDLRDMGAALRHYAAALNIVREVGDTVTEHLVLGNLGYIYHELGDAGRARAAYEQVIAFARASGDREGEAATAWNLGRLLLGHGERERGLALMRQYLAYLREVGHAAEAEYAAYMRAAESAAPEGS